MGKLTISMAIFNSYVCLSEGTMVSYRVLLKPTHQPIKPSKAAIYPASPQDLAAAHGHFPADGPKLSALNTSPSNMIRVEHKKIIGTSWENTLLVGGFNLPL